MRPLAATGPLADARDCQVEASCGTTAEDDGRAVPVEPELCIYARVRARRYCTLDETDRPPETGGSPYSSCKSFDRGRRDTFVLLLHVPRHVWNPK